MRVGSRSPLMAAPIVALVLAAACAGSDSTSPRSNGPDNDFVVQIAAHSATVATGSTLQLSAAVMTRGGTASNSAVAWSSADPAVASVTPTGLVSALAVGPARIVARAGSGADTAQLTVLAPNISVAVSPGIFSIPLGDTLRLAVNVQSAASAYSYAPITWKSSDSSVAVVDGDGVVSALKEGEVTLTAAVAGGEGSASVRVTRSPVAYVTVSPINNTIHVSELVTLSATAYDAFSRVVKGSRVTWTSSDLRVATVTDRGVVTAKARGSAAITASVEKSQASASMNVMATPVAVVSVSLDAAKLSVGQSTKATATLLDDTGQPAEGRVIAWQSSNPALVTVTSSGTVTAVLPGSVTISAISEGKIGSASLQVVQGTAASIEIIPSAVSVRVGETSILVAKVKDAAGGLLTGRPLSWSTGSAAIAAISASGELTGVSVGSTTVTATSDGIVASAPLTVTTVPVASVQISGATHLTVGGAVQLNAVALDGAGNPLPGRLPSWSSDRPTVAAVSAAGMASGVSPGDAAITATIDGQSASIALDVAAPPPAPVASVTLTLTTSSLVVGQTSQATVAMKDGSGTVLSGRTATWASSDPALATVSSSGLVTAVAPGSVTISATSEGQTGMAALSIVAPAPAPVATVSLIANSNALNVGQTTQISVVLKDASGGVLDQRAIAWATSDAHVASVSPAGLVTALGAGSATISATSEGKTGSVTITVTAPASTPNAVASVQVTVASPSVTLGQTTQASAELRDAAGNVLAAKPMTWGSSNASVASVSATGLVTSLGIGSTVVSAMVDGKSGQASVTVSAPTTPSTNRSWYASPTGGTVAAGTLASPWSLATALSHPGVVQPGDTIWLRGGVYRADFISRLTGTADRPIVVRQSPGERATVDGRLEIDGSYTHYRDFEVMYSDTRRVTSIAGSDPGDLPREYKTVFVTGPFNKLINLVIHDLGDGIFSGLSAEGLEIYGSIIYNNGWRGPDRGHGHNVYLQNQVPTKYLTDNVLFNSFSSGLHIYGSSAAALWYFSIEGNTIFESGSPVAREFGADVNVLHQGAGGKFGRSVYRRNSIYHRVGSEYSFVFNGAGDTPGEDIQFLDNISQGRAQFHEVRRYVVTGNKLTTGSAPLSGQTMLMALRMVSGEPFSSHVWDRNTYAAPSGDQVPFYLVQGSASNLTMDQWRKVTGYDANSSYTVGRFTGADVVVRPNRYEPGRALVTCWNWSGYGSLAADLSSVLKVGDRFVIHHVYDLFGTPLVSGTYGGGSVSIPQTAITPPTPVGYDYTPPATGPGFGVFVVRKL